MVDQCGMLAARPRPCAYGLQAAVVDGDDDDIGMRLGRCQLADRVVKQVVAALDDLSQTEPQNQQDRNDGCDDPFHQDTGPEGCHGGASSSFVGQ